MNFACLRGLFAAVAWETPTNLTEFEVLNIWLIRGRETERQRCREG